jgi:opine dehydrogenase
VTEVKKIAVLGAGSGGFMSAADFGEMGYEVALFSRNPDKIDAVREKGGIEVLDIDSKPTGVFGKVECATSNISEAVKGAQVILNPIPYFVCEEYARMTAPYLEEGQIVLYLGKGGASLTWAKVLKEMGIKKRVYLADCNTLPYGTSKKGGYQVRLENRTQNLIIAAFPGKDIGHVLDVIRELYPPEHGYELRAGQNAIDSILVDYNAITHTPPMICNAARIESGDNTFHLFGKKENTPGVVNLIKKIDRERIAIGEKLGLEQHTLEEEIMMVKWNPNLEDYVLPLYDAIHTPFLEVCEGPFSLKARHLTEDIPYGLVTFSSLGKLLGVPTPVTDACITIAEGLLEEDFRSKGRTARSLGLDPAWSLNQIKKYLQEGTV